MKYILDFDFTIQGTVTREVEADSQEEAEKQGERLMLNQKHRLEEEACNQAAANMEVDDIDFVNIAESKN